MVVSKELSLFSGQIKLVLSLYHPFPYCYHCIYNKTSSGTYTELHEYLREMQIYDKKNGIIMFVLLA